MPECKTVTLGELAEIFDGPHATPAKTEAGPWFLSISSLNRGRLDLDQSAHISEKDFETWTRRVVPREGDVLFSYETRLGEAALMPAGVRACLGRRMGLLRARPDKVDSRFLLYAYLAPKFQDVIRQRSIQGATVDRIPLSELATWPIDLPSSRQQRLIGAVLGALDEKIVANERLVSSARELMRCHYEAAIAASSAATTVGDVAVVIDGPHATPRKTQSGPWFLSISSLHRGRLILKESAHISEQDLTRWTRRVTPLPGDILFSYETRLGEAAMMPRGIRACLGRRMALLRPLPHRVGPRTLLQAFLSGAFQDTIRQRAVHGATVDRIPLTELPSWPIILAARDSELLEDALGGLDDLASHVDRESESLTILRDTLLARLVSGEIRVRDAEKIVEERT
jgi:type I restriction enzyme, S subunit